MMKIHTLSKKRRKHIENAFLKKENIRKGKYYDISLSVNSYNSIYTYLMQVLGLYLKV